MPLTSEVQFNRKFLRIQVGIPNILKLPQQHKDLGFRGPKHNLLEAHDCVGGTECLAAEKWSISNYRLSHFWIDFKQERPDFVCVCVCVVGKDSCNYYKRLRA